MIFLQLFNDVKRKYSEPPSLYSQAASQVAPSPAGEGWGEENKIKTFLISPSSKLLPLEKAFAER